MSKKEHHYHDCVDLNMSASIEQCMNEERTHLSHLQVRV